MGGTGGLDRRDSNTVGSKLKKNFTTIRIRFTNLEIILVGALKIYF